MLRIIIISIAIHSLAIFVIFGMAYSIESEMRPGDWHKINEPRVIRYLSSLQSSDIGMIVEGVELSDGDLAVYNLKFLGRVDKLGRGVHLYLFTDSTRTYAYIWIDESGESLPLPDCSELYPNEEGQYGLSGDVYTWKSVQPGHGVVISHCPKEEWLRMKK
ncbi:hypothetical protein D3OALGA1CA_3599 [Olavius algarvensis associated proteobacterium Delta 3]|nr:hypothetical protein D3OALGB2SA_2274 [Olavius algarvensis associated proteobacterium Delta 3]CAB5136862.1 hypothetical protein D3OALGA1CA_3599 [Olavius algarvensis associated proteobacterium Delta 3]